MSETELQLAARIPMLQTLKIRLAEVGDRHAVMEVVVDASHRNFYGGTHGGLIATLVDTVSFFPRPLIPSGKKLTTTGMSVSYVRAAAVGDRLRARSELLHLGRRTASLAVKVADAAGRLLAHGTVNLMVLPDDPIDAG